MAEEGKIRDAVYGILDNKCLVELMPVGTIILRNATEANGGMPFGVWNYSGNLTIDNAGAAIRAVAYTRVN